MKEIILVKYGEIILKGLNRPQFEDLLVRNIKRAIKDMGEMNIYKAQATVYIEPGEDVNVKKLIERLKKVYGIVAIIKAIACEKTLESICENATEGLAGALKKVKTFKVETKRADKKFSLKSPEISREVGGYLLSKFHNLSVDVNEPDTIVKVEIRDYNAFVYCESERIKGIGGMPTGSNGRAMLLLSGGIDSPVAGHMIAKRGVVVNAVHFFSYPYTGERAKEKVISLAKQVAEFEGGMKLIIVPFTKIQEQIRDLCPEDLLTLVMRRYMMKIAERVAKKNYAQALITGESVGQVASQTMEALSVTDNAVSMPVLRPVIGMDKNEIVEISKTIGTFETSVLPYEDCCTVFTPRHPKTKPNLEEVVKAENLLDMENLINEAVENIEIIDIK